MNSNITIRPLQEKDTAAVEQVCIKTAPPSAVKTAKEREYIINMYSKYYTQVERDFSFVAVNENDEAVGYVLCAADYYDYKARFNKYIAPAMLKLGVHKWVQAKSEIGAMWCFTREYPAHLHINILPEYQRSGLGTLLMDALFEKLSASGIKGVMLIVSPSNEKGIGFYKKYGFKEVARIGGIVYGHSF